MDSWITGRPALHVLGAGVGRERADGVLVHTSAEVGAALSSSFPPDRIFYCAPFDSGVSRVQNSCRFVAGSLEDLRYLDDAAGQTGADGVFRTGLRLQAPELPRVENAILPDELARYAREIRLLRHLTVRGCFFCGDLTAVHGKMLGRFFRSGYETAKRMTVTLPCAMPYLCFENAVAAIEENIERHPETTDDCFRALDIMTMQNETAFYAKLFLS